MRFRTQVSERAVVLAPKGRDAEVAIKILEEAGFIADSTPSIATLVEEFLTGAGLAIIADEAVQHANLKSLADALSQQQPWSDFPIVLLTQRGGGPERNPAAARLAQTLGNVTFLERPFHPTTLVSVVRTAIRGRRRQYEARSRLEELSEGEQQLKTALTAGDLGSWTLNVVSMTLRASEKCRSHFGRGLNDTFTYSDLISAVHPDDISRMQIAVANTLATGENYAIEYRNIWPDGSVHWVDVRGRAERNDKGAVEHLVGVSSNITDRKNAELERERLLSELAVERASLSKLTATLEERVNDRTTELMAEVAAREKAQARLVQSQKMETIGQLTGGVAHDFNNLLMAVMGNLELLRKRLTDDVRSQRLIAGALQGAQRGAALTQRMLAFARQQDLKTGAADLSVLLSGMRDLLDRTLGPQVTLTVDAPSGLPPAQVDANQIELAVLNLTINARDAMPTGGEIRITLRSEEPRHIKDGERGYLLLSVADTGTGMDAGTLAKAIEPFFSTKPIGKGTGLGLSMVHGLAVQLGGRLLLESKVGSGTIATLRLPIAVQKNDQVSAPLEETRTSTRAATILVVDDDQLIASSTVNMLEDLGHTVIEANSAKHALEILDNGQSVDLMITDQAMPGMTGIELAEIVLRKRPDLPILLATGYAEISPGQSLKLPRLSKPYLQSQLQAHVDSLLSEAS